MDAIKYIKDKTRMCREINCKDCNLSHWLNGTEHSCSEFAYLYPEKAVAIVEKWSEEHPQKTMLTDFKEKYPKAVCDGDGMPEEICPWQLGYEEYKGRCSYECVECWNRPLEVD